MAQPFSSGQRAALRALCGTFVPTGGAPDDGTGDAHAARLEALFASVADPKARGQLYLLLTALDSRVGSFLLGGRLRPFAGLDPDARVRFLLDMGSSAIQLRRAAFQALKRLTLLARYAWPATGDSHPEWRAAGYPGPLPHHADEDNRALPLLSVERDTTLDCDVVVVGSGAGGGVVAGVLATAGLSVVVLEKGEYRLPRDLSHIEGEALAGNYLDRGLLQTGSGSLPILAGSCLGGGTVINYTTSFELPEATAREWSRLSGLGLFTSGRLRESFARVKERIHVTDECSTPSRRDQILENGCRALGWHWGVIRRNVRACPGPLECGYCGYGCRHGAKQSTTVTYLADAAHAGARIVVRCDAERVLIEHGRAAGVAGRVRRADGTSVALTVRAGTVVAACGGLHTPALLVRSGLNNSRIGRGLRLHPGTAVGAFFEERVEPWVGFQQTRYSDQFADQTDGYGVKLETVSVAFALPASGFGWEGPAPFRSDLSRLGHVSIVALLLRDRDPGRVVTGRDGRPRVHYELSRFDAGHVRAAMRGAAELLGSQGAREVFTAQQPPARARPDGAGWLDHLMADADARGYARCRQTFVSFHQMASCAMGCDPARSVVGESGESHDVPGLFVADASAFVTSSGVNPMLTIMALADHVARGIAERR